MTGKSKLLTLSIITIFIVLISILYLPLFLPNQFFSVPSYAGLNKPNFSINNKLNPFQPTATVFIPLSDEKAYLIKEESFVRVGLFSFRENSERFRGGVNSLLIKFMLRAMIKL